MTGLAQPLPCDPFKIWADHRGAWAKFVTPANSIVVEGWDFCLFGEQVGPGVIIYSFYPTEQPILLLYIYTDSSKPNLPCNRPI